MSYDSHSDDDEVDAKDSREGRTRRFQDFDCPGCNANNPYDDKFGDGDEVLCFYCGQEYKVRVSDEGRLRLQEA
jgi:transcription elongation factor Elf1